MMSGHQQMSILTIRTVIGISYKVELIFLCKALNYDLAIFLMAAPRQKLLENISSVSKRIKVVKMNK
jgi:hypothetical protein